MSERRGRAPAANGSTEVISVIYSTHLRPDFKFRSADRFMSDDVRRSPPEETDTASAIRIYVQRDRVSLGLRGVRQVLGDNNSIRSVPRARSDRCS